MSSLPIDSIANIASFLPLQEQVKTFPKFNNCIKKVENKKKLIRRALYNWRLDFLKEVLNPATYNFKRYTPLAFRKQLVEECMLLRNGRKAYLTFGEMVDSIGLLGKSILLRKIEKMHGLFFFCFLELRKNS